jgi:hypothetical protein
MKTILAVIALAVVCPAFAQTPLTQQDLQNALNNQAVLQSIQQQQRDQQAERQNGPTLYQQSMRGYTAGEDAREQQARIEAMQAQTEALRAQTAALRQAQEDQAAAQQVGQRCFPGTAQLPRPGCY